MAATGFLSCTVNYPWWIGIGKRLFLLIRSYFFRSMCLENSIPPTSTERQHVFYTTADSQPKASFNRNWWVRVQGHQISGRCWAYSFSLLLPVWNAGGMKCPKARSRLCRCKSSFDASPGQLIVDRSKNVKRIFIFQFIRQELIGPALKRHRSCKTLDAIGTDKRKPRIGGGRKGPPCCMLRQTSTPVGTPLRMSRPQRSLTDSTSSPD